MNWAHLASLHVTLPVFIFRLWKWCLTWMTQRGLKFRPLQQMFECMDWFTSTDTLCGGSLSPSVAKESLFSSCANVPDETFMLLAGRHKSKMIEIATFLQQTVHKLCSLPTVVTHLLWRGALWNVCVSKMDTSNLSFSEYCNSCQHSQQTSPNCLQTLLPPSVPG